MTPMQKPGFRRLLTRFLVVLKDRFFVMFFGIWEDLTLDSGHMKYSHAPLCHKEKLSPCHPPSKTAFARRGCRFRAVFLRCWWWYNMTQMLFNAFVSSQLLREAWAWLGSSDRKPMEHENIFVNIYEHIYNGVPKKVRISSLPILMVI